MGGGTSYGFENDVWRSTDKGVTWVLMNASAGWSPRYLQSSVAMPDGNIVLMGGAGVDGLKNDTWRSTNNGATWTLMNASSGWTVREMHSSVLMPDGSIVLMGGFPGNYWMYNSLNDVWRSTDEGATWTLMNAGAEWLPRCSQSSVSLPDGSIVLMGGDVVSTLKNDVWRSTDNGATWTLMNASAGCSPRTCPSAVSMPDGSIILTGGLEGSKIKNDMWRSTDYGATWTLINASIELTPRAQYNCVGLPDGSIVLMGGVHVDTRMNDVWRFMPAGSSEQNPLHIYRTPGIYQVSQQVYNNNGDDSEQITGYITILPPMPTNISLQSGWNFISVPKTLAPGNNTGSVFSKVEMGGHSAWMWDESQNPPAWIPILANTPIQPLYGYWIYSASDTYVNLTFETYDSFYPAPVPPSRSLPAGWNAVGFTADFPTSARNTYLSVQSSWVNSMGFDAGNQR